MRALTSKSAALSSSSSTLVAGIAECVAGLELLRLVLLHEVPLLSRLVLVPMRGVTRRCEIARPIDAYIFGNQTRGISRHSSMASGALVVHATCSIALRSFAVIYPFDVVF